MDHAVCDRTRELIETRARAVLDGQTLSAAQAEALVEVSGSAVFDLFYWAHRIRLAYVGEAVTWCSIVPGRVGACSEDCSFCSQSSRHRTSVQPSRTELDQIEAATAEAADRGATNMGVVNSGRGPTRAELDRLEPFFRKTAGEGKIVPCATLGELTAEQADRLAAMGVKRINHNLETSRRFYPAICQTHSYDDRLRTLRHAKAAGLSLCSGGIFGLGETWADRIDMALALRELDVDVVPINFLNAIEGTAIHAATAGRTLEPIEALKIVAVYRFLLPDKTLKVAGGREKILGDMQNWMFFAGANSFLIGNYLTTLGRTPDEDFRMLRDLQIPVPHLEHEADVAISLPML
jgi:biotin synthase